MDTMAEKEEKQEKPELPEGVAEKEGDAAGVAEPGGKKPEDPPAVVGKKGAAVDEEAQPQLAADLAAVQAEEEEDAEEGEESEDEKGEDEKGEDEKEGEKGEDEKEEEPPQGPGKGKGKPKASDDEEGEDEDDDDDGPPESSPAAAPPDPDGGDPGPAVVPRSPGKEEPPQGPGKGKGKPKASDDEEGEDEDDDDDGPALSTFDIIYCQLCDLEATSTKTGFCKAHNSCIKTARGKAKAEGAESLRDLNSLIAKATKDDDGNLDMDAKLGEMLEAIMNTQKKHSGRKGARKCALAYKELPWHGWFVSFVQFESNKVRDRWRLCNFMQYKKYAEKEYGLKKEKEIEQAWAKEKKTHYGNVERAICVMAPEIVRDRGSSFQATNTMKADGPHSYNPTLADSVAALTGESMGASVQDAMDGMGMERARGEGGADGPAASEKKKKKLTGAQRMSAGRKGSVRLEKATLTSTSMETDLGAILVCETIFPSMLASEKKYFLAAALAFVVGHKTFSTLAGMVKKGEVKAKQEDADAWLAKLSELVLAQLKVDKVQDLVVGILEPITGTRYTKADIEAKAKDAAESIVKKSYVENLKEKVSAKPVAERLKEIDALIDEFRGNDIATADDEKSFLKQIEALETVNSEAKSMRDMFKNSAKAIAKSSRKGSGKAKGKFRVTGRGMIRPRAGTEALRDKQMTLGAAFNSHAVSLRHKWVAGWVVGGLSCKRARRNLA
jgi:hypothetical protein